MTTVAEVVPALLDRLGLLEREQSLSLVRPAAQAEDGPRRHGFAARLDPRNAAEDAKARKAERAPRPSFREAMAVSKQGVEAKRAAKLREVAAPPPVAQGWRL